MRGPNGKGTGTPLPVAVALPPTPMVGDFGADKLVDLPAAVIAAGARAGLIPVARYVALLAGLRGGKLIARPSFFQLDNLRRARRPGPALAPDRARGRADLPQLLKFRKTEP